jgi:hypothetical protein
LFDFIHWAMKMHFYCCFFPHICSLKCCLWNWWKNITVKGLIGCFLNFEFHCNGQYEADLHQSHLRARKTFFCATSMIFCRNCNLQHIGLCTWSDDNKVHELIAVKMLHTSLLNITVSAAFKVLPLGSYASMPAPSPPFKTILELVLWNGLERCCCITQNAFLSVFPLSSGTGKMSLGARSGE